MRNRAKVVTISLPQLGASQLCPMKALKTMLAVSSHDLDFPLFQVNKSAGYVPLMYSVAKKHLCTISNMLSLSKVLTFHDCRRGSDLGFQA